MRQPEAMKIGILAFGGPDRFTTTAPYLNQLSHLIPPFSVVGEVVWICFSSNRQSSLPDLRDSYPNLTAYHHWSVSTNSAIYVSNINLLCKTHRIDAILSLFDLNRIFVDEVFVPVAVHWHPNHFVPLDAHSAHALPAYDTIASLAPSDARSISLQLPHARVVVVPHFVQAKPSFRSKKHLRAEFGVRADASFVVLVQFCNYNNGNRKGVDVSVQAFRILMSSLPNAFLYVHATTIAKSIGHVQQLDVWQMLREANVPNDRYIISDRELSDDANTRLIEMADVLCNPSKVEGFGMAVLEAQALGVPVVTTRVGAMADYTFNGVSVPPIQNEWLQIGYVSTPNVSGVAEALAYVAARPEAYKKASKTTQSFVKREFSLARVSALLLVELQRPKQQRKFATMLFDQDSSHPSNEHNGWTVIADRSHAILPSAINAILKTYSVDSLDDANLHPLSLNRLVVIQTRENDNSLTPLPADVSRRTLSRNVPVVALPTATLRDHLASTPGGVLEVIASILMRQGDSSPMRIMTGGLGSVRRPEPLIGMSRSVVT